MKLKFSKMHGLGNDFVVIDAITQPVDLSPALVRRLADRQIGVGCDQLLVVERPSAADVDFHYRIFNADGGEVEQCGNGERCFVRFVHERGLTDKRAIRVETRSGVISPTLNEDGTVTVDMGVPRLRAAEVPFVSDSDAPVQPLALPDGSTVAITNAAAGWTCRIPITGTISAPSRCRWAWCAAGRGRWFLSPAATTATNTKARSSPAACSRGWTPPTLPVR